jgi:Putative metallopeptidase
MSVSRSKMTTLVIAAAVGVVLGMPRSSAAQSEPTSDQSHRVSIVYIPPSNSALQAQYDVLKERRALEQIQEILSPFRWPQELTIKTAECGVVNSWYKRENLQPTVTICYEFLKNILESLPNETTPEGITAADAAVGQFLWVAFHEVGHAAFDMFDVPIFGSVEDAADNFATYIILQFGENQARRLIVGAAWAWRAYLGDYKRGRAAATGGLCQRPRSAARALLQSFVPGRRRPTQSIRRPGGIFTDNAIATLRL